MSRKERQTGERALQECAKGCRVKISPKATIYDRHQTRIVDAGFFCDSDLKSSLTFFDYVTAFYKYYYGDEDEGLQAASYWNASITTWNTHMTTYKTCQPCRAYNLGKFDDDQEEEEDSHDGSKDDKRRFPENNDGEGEEEQWGFNCYDDAGYTNCNQVKHGRLSTICTLLKAPKHWLTSPLFFSSLNDSATNLKLKQTWNLFLWRI